MNLSLNGIWNLSSSCLKKAIAANVPGDNYTALEAAGIIPDPFYGLNEWEVQWPVRESWCYSRTFDVPAKACKAGRLFLEFTSIDTVAEVVLNGKVIGSVNNEFRLWRFDVTDTIKAGENSVEVRIVALEKAINDDIAAHPHKDVISWGCNTLHQIERLRKTQCASGWDWGISLPVSGIYGDVRLFSAKKAIVNYLWDEQSFKEDGSAVVTLTAEVEPTLAAKAGDKVEVVFTFDGKEKVVSGVVPRSCAAFTVSEEFKVKSPRLWWPNGMGDQPLYSASIKVEDATIERKIGLRTVEVVREADESGESFGFRVNGKAIVAKGTNWIPCEAHPEKRTKERYLHLVASMANANMNMVRMWGGGLYEPEFFYEECDRLGILVWQDLMFACGVYPDWQEFTDNVRAEVAHQIKRLRSHPSIALWCGDNENISCVYVTRSHYALIDRLTRTTGEVVAKCDPTRTFWPSSPCSGDREYEKNFNRAMGDAHLWGLGGSDRSFAAFLTERCRFVSEFGFSSFPSIDLVRTFADDDELNATSPVMFNHVKKDSAPSAIFSMMSEYFRMPEGFEKTIELSQINQANALANVSARWRLEAPYCQGILVWQINDWWPVTSWSTIEYNGRWKPSNYAIKRAFSPLMAHLRHDKPEESAEVFVAWDIERKLDANVAVAVRRVKDGAEVATYESELHFDGAGVLSAGLPDFNGDAALRGGLAQKDCFITIELSGKDAEGKKYSFENSALLVYPRQLTYVKAEPTVAKVTKKGEGTFAVAVTATAPSFFTTLFVKDDPEGIFDDNCVTVLPEGRTFIYKTKSAITAAELKDKLKVFAIN